MFLNISILVLVIITLVSANKSSSMIVNLSSFLLYKTHCECVWLYDMWEWQICWMGQVSMSGLFSGEWKRLRRCEFPSKHTFMFWVWQPFDVSGCEMQREKPEDDLWRILRSCISNFKAFSRRKPAVHRVRGNI